MINKELVKELKNIKNNYSLDQSITKLLNKIHFPFSIYSEQNNLDNKIIIIDECQRLREEDIQYINDAINTKFIFIGDYKQSIYFNDVGLNKNEFENWERLELTKYYRIEEKTIEIIENIFGLENNDIKKGKIKNKQFNISIYNDSTKWANKFKNEINDNSNLFLGTTSNTNKNNEELIKNNVFLFEKETRNRWLYFYDINSLNKICFSTFEIISREFESAYIFIPDNFIVDNNQVTIKNIEDQTIINIFLNQLFVLLTRATTNLHVYIQDKDYYSFVDNKLKEYKDKFH